MKTCSLTVAFPFSFYLRGFSLFFLFFLGGGRQRFAVNSLIKTMTEMTRKRLWISMVENDNPNKLLERNLPL